MNTPVTIKGKIQRLGKDTPTASGWFSAKILTYAFGTVQVTGDVNGYEIHEGLTISCKAMETYKPGWGTQYEILKGSLRVVTANEQGTIRFFSGPNFKGIGTVAAKKCTKPSKKTCSTS